MLFVRVALVILGINLAFLLLSTLSIPIAECTSSSCETWAHRADTEWSDSIVSDVDDGQYKTTQVESGQSQNLDLFTATIKSIDLALTFAGGLLDGGYSLTCFTLMGGGSNTCDDGDGVTSQWEDIAASFANVIKVICYIVYALGIIQVIRGINMETSSR